MIITPDLVAFDVGEVPVVDGATRAHWDPDRGVWRVELLRGRTDIANGQGLPLAHGALLCVDNSRPLLQTLLSTDPDDQVRVDALLSRLNGPMIATRDWSNRWLAFQATVPTHTQDWKQLKTRWSRDWSEFQALSPFDDSWRGLMKNAGGTGSQFDFGASKGSEFTLRDPRFAFTWRRLLDEPLRPMHYRELDGSPVTKDAHPNWWTWSQLTHWHCQQSPDRLGKPCPEPAHNAHGWTGKDDQHKSSNGLAAAIATFDWPSCRALLRDEVEASLSNIRIREKGTGAPRAIGRRLLADANAYLLTGEERVWQQLVEFHASNAYRKSAGFGMPATAMRIQSANVDARNLSNPQTGKPWATVVVWEHGLELNGIAAAWNVAMLRGEPSADLGALFAMHVTTMADHFFRKDSNGRWFTWLQIHYDGGKPIAEEILMQGRAGWTKDKVYFGAGWMEWIYPALYYLARTPDHGVPISAAVQAKLDDMADQWDEVVGVPASLDSREWLAVVQR